MLAEEYKAAHPGVTFEIAAEGSTTGISAIVDGTAQIGMSSRRAKPTEMSAGTAKGVSLKPTIVAFDGIADATGFDFSATRGEVPHAMGAQIPLADELRLRARAPLAGHWKLICSGELLAEGDGADFDRKIDQPGVYRVEWWLDVAGQRRIWILSNPIYVSAK